MEGVTISSPDGSMVAAFFAVGIAVNTTPMEKRDLTALALRYQDGPSASAPT